MSKRRTVACLILHSLTFLMAAFGSFIRFTGFRIFGTVQFRPGWESLRFFTVESNVLMGIIAVICITFDILLLAKKKPSRPKWLVGLEYFGVCAVAMTMFTILLILGPAVWITTKDFNQFLELFESHNLFFHLLVPISAIAAFLLRQDKMRLTKPLLAVSVIPIFAYAVFYFINALVHVDAEGKVPSSQDWYGFARIGMNLFWIPFIAMVLFGFLVSLAVFFTDRKISSKRERIE